MPRVKRGNVRRAKRKKLLARAKGFYQTKSKLYRSAKESVDTALKYAFVGRRRKKRDFRRLWVVRINAAARQEGLSYNQFVAGCRKANIVLDRKALADIAGRISQAIREGRQNEVMYHVGRPGEDGFTERVLAAWGVDGHNSHTNICSAAARAGYELWCGIDRPSPDHARAKVIYLVSSHLEAGHYFNPHAQRILEGKKNGAKLIVVDTRLSNSATHADHWLAPQPGSEAAMHLAFANFIIQEKRYDREFLRRWWNWQEYLAELHPEAPPTFESFEALLAREYAEYTFEFAAAESGVAEATLRDVAELVASAGTRLSTHTWRSATAGNEGGWQVARTLFLLNALLGAVATEGGTYPNAWNKFVPRPIHLPPRHPDKWNELNWPREFPLSMYEMSFLLPHFLLAGPGKLDV